MSRSWRPTPHDFERLTSAVEKAEATTTAEIVVAFRDQSGSYRDTAYLTGALVAFLGLTAIILNPWTMHDELFLPLEVMLLFVGGATATHLLPIVRRLLTTKARRAEQVHAAAQLAYLDEGVDQTTERTGLLIYLSAFERRIELVADRGVLAAITPAAWQAATEDFATLALAPDTVPALIAAIERLAVVLADRLPGDADNPDEIPNRPRIG